MFSNSKLPKNWKFLLSLCLLIATLLFIIYVMFFSGDTFGQLLKSDDIIAEPEQPKEPNKIECNVVLADYGEEQIKNISSNSNDGLLILPSVSSDPKYAQLDSILIGYISTKNRPYDIQIAPENLYYFITSGANSYAVIEGFVSMGDRYEAEEDLIENNVGSINLYLTKLDYVRLFSTNTKLP